MRIALNLTPPSDENLRLAAQIGVTDIVARYPGLKLDDLLALRDRIEDFGMKLSIIEGYIPHDRIVHGKSGWDEQILDFVTLIRNMGKAGVAVCCYNFMPDDDWSRTNTTTPERGGASVTSFDAKLLRHTAPAPGGAITADQLWKNLEQMLKIIIPAAEEAGVNLALHPDDPPMSPLRGQDRIITSSEAYERVFNIEPSPTNGICFCQGTFAEMGDMDIPSMVHRFGNRIHYAHFRDVVGAVPKFRESFHDNGKTDMAAAMRAYHEVGFRGPMRPDHVPTLEGESNDTPGYHMLGRLYAVGYIRGLSQAVLRGDDHK